MISLFVFLVLSYLHTLILPSAEMNGSAVKITEVPFGAVDLDGKFQPVTKFILTNQKGGEVHFISLGAAITNLMVNDKHGQLQDVVLGFQDVNGYLHSSNPYFGAIVGRVANRIAKGTFTLMGVKYNLAKNNGNNSLHGGLRGFDKVVWSPFAHADGRLSFSYSSPHLEEGFPGHLFVQVTYTFTHDNELIIDLKAITDRPTPINLANHAYFNLAGHTTGSQGLYEHRIEFQAEKYTPVDDGLIPTGSLTDVDGTIFDLRKETRLGDVINKVPGGGYDHNFVVNKKSLSKFNGTLPLVAKIWHPQSGRVLQVFSDQPGFQFYTGNFLPSDGSLIGKNKTAYSTHGGLCIETQNFPDAINQANFPSCVLEPGSVYQRTSIYKFSTQN